MDAHGKHLFIRFENALVIHSHLRMSGRMAGPRQGLADARQHLADHPRRREARRPDQRPDPRADDGEPHPLRPAVSPASAPTSSPRSSTRTPSCGGCAPTTPPARSVTPCSTSGSSPASATCGRSRAASWPGSTRGGGPATSATKRCSRSSTRPARGCRQSALDGMQDKFKVVYGTAGQPCPRCGELSNIRCTRAGRRQPHRHTGVHDVSTEAADRSQRRGPDRARQHARLLRRGARPRRRHDRVRRPAREPARAREGPPAARPRLRARRATPPRSRKGSRTSRARPFDGLELDVDLKLPGYEQRVVDALRAHGLVERTLISSNWMRSLIVLRELEPKLRLGYSVPRLRKDPTQMWLTKLPAYAAAAWFRASCRRRSRCTWRRAAATR